MILCCPGLRTDDLLLAPRFLAIPAGLTRVIVASSSGPHAQMPLCHILSLIQAPKMLADAMIRMRRV